MANNVIITCSITKEQKEFLKEKGLSASKILQQKIDEVKESYKPD